MGTLSGEDKANPVTASIPGSGMPAYLGMYVHTHWAYNRPYAARSWTLEDWEGYLGGLKGLGYNMILVWPQLDCMPAEPNSSDMAWLNLLGSVIDLAHQRFAMKVAMVVCPNTIGNEKACAYEFTNRPYFVCEKKVNPSDPGDVARFLEGRRHQLKPLAAADALAIIDSDPGGYIGSLNADFVNLMDGQIKVFREFNPSAELIYWMLVGWERYNLFWEITAQGEKLADIWSVVHDKNDFIETLQGMQRQIAEPWSVFASTPDHNAALDALGMREKAMWYPYGMIEGEPTFPLTNYDAARLSAVITPGELKAYPRGVMANSQTHCLQLPLAALFAHLSDGKTLETFDLAGFAGALIPGFGKVVAEAWSVLESGSPEKLMSAYQNLRSQREGQAIIAGPLSSLLFGSAKRFLDDLQDNLQVRAALAELDAAFQNNQGIPAALRKTLDVLRPYQQRLGFVDAYGDPMYSFFNSHLEKLNDPELNAVLHQFNDWSDPSVRNNIVPRLLHALESYCRRAG